MKRLIALLTIITGSLLFGVTFGYALNINPVIPTIVSIVGSFVPLPQGCAYQLVFTAAGGVGTAFTFPLTYLPQFFYYSDGGNPLTSLRVETKEDGVLLDLNAAAIAVINGYMHAGTFTANDTLLRLANGQLWDKNVTISGVTSAVGAVNMFASSDNIGTAPFKYSNGQILALAPQKFINFSALWVPAAATATDRFEVVFLDGHRCTFDPLELAALSTMYQQVSRVLLNNIDGYIDYVNVVCAAGHPAYLMSIAIPQK
jgi:hypothetical protein